MSQTQPFHLLFSGLLLCCPGGIQEKLPHLSLEGGGPACLAPCCWPPRCHINLGTGPSSKTSTHPPHTHRGREHGPESREWMEWSEEHASESGEISLTKRASLETSSPRMTESSPPPSCCPHPVCHPHKVPPWIELTALRAFPASRRAIPMESWKTKDSGLI